MDDTENISMYLQKYNWQIISFCGRNDVNRKTDEKFVNKQIPKFHFLLPTSYRKCLVSFGNLFSTVNLVFSLTRYIFSEKYFSGNSLT